VLCWKIWQFGEIYPPISTVNPVIGGHAVVIVGYTQYNGQLVLIVRNSWGTAWGDNGYFYCNIGVLNSDMMNLWVLESFNGVNGVAPDVTSIPVPPTGDSTVIELLTYIFQTKFGRKPQPAGETFWTNAIITYFIQQVVAGAQGADKAYMAANPPSSAYVMPTPSSTLNQILTYIYQTYFGRLPLPAGELFWSNDIISYLTTQVVAGASQTDKYFMAANNIT